MSGKLDLRPEVRDALAEIFNIGIGAAAGVLSELVNDEILLTVPELGVTPHSDFAHLAGTLWTEPASIVRQSFQGPFGGDALLVFPAKESLELVRALLAEPTPIEAMTELEREALLEVGNIILNACLSCIADLLEHEITNSLPIYLESDPGALVGSLVTDPDSHVMFIRIDFSVKRQNMGGNILFVLDVPAATVFGAAVEKLVNHFESGP
ncbi:MAG: chemotaxis protein CheC [Rhodospirillaceae bacterium]